MKITKTMLRNLRNMYRKDDFTYFVVNNMLKDCSDFDSVQSCIEYYQSYSCNQGICSWNIYTYQNKELLAKYGTTIFLIIQEYYETIGQETMDIDLLDVNKLVWLATDIIHNNIPTFVEVANR